MIKPLVRKRFPLFFNKAKDLFYYFYKTVLRKSQNELIFTRIYRRNLWGNKDSRSGDGSSLENTLSIQAELPVLIKTLGIKSILDIPCGDFFWMKEIELPVAKYTGADIVKELIFENNRKYGSPITSFLVLDITTDYLPESDLIICRDCLPHLPNKSIMAALKQIKISKSKFLLTSTYTGATKNEDKPPGIFHPVNLQLDPFNLPEPEKIINDACISERMNLPDKSLGLWKISEIPDC